MARVERDWDRYGIDTRDASRSNHGRT
jgi:hypothetical protein